MPSSPIERTAGQTLHPNMKMRTLRLVVVALVVAVVSLAAFPSIFPSRSSAAVLGSSTEQITPISTIDTSGIHNAAGANGDGWDSTVYNNNVYVVWHNVTGLNIMCYSSLTGSPCLNYPVTVTNGADPLQVSENPTVYRNSSGMIYVYAVDTTTQTSGVAKINLNNGASLDSFIPLTPAGQGWSTSSNEVGISNGVIADSRFYAFNFETSVNPSGAIDTLLCLDLSTDQPCSNQPYAVSYADPANSSKKVWGLSPFVSLAAQISLVGSNVLVEVGGDNNNCGNRQLTNYDGCGPGVGNPTNPGTANDTSIGCIVATSGLPCSGSWPVDIQGMDWMTWIALYGKPFPMLASNGSVTGFCVPTGIGQHFIGDASHNQINCYDQTGARVTLPAAEASALQAAILPEASSAWSGNAITVGTQIYLPVMDSTSLTSSIVACWDWSTQATCSASYPESLSGATYMYTLESSTGDLTQPPSPSNQVCLWEIADHGTASIVSFNPAGGTCPAVTVTTYNLTYNTNPPTGAPSATGSTPSQVTGILSGATETLANNPNNLAISGYAFGGWSATQGGTTPITSVGPITQDQNVYAIWTPVYNLTYNADPPAGAPSPTGSVPSQVTGIAPGSTESLASNPNNLAVTGYDFGGWASAPGGTTPITSVGPINSNQNVYAIWTPQTPQGTYTLQYDPNPPSGASVSGGSVPAPVTAISPGSTEPLASNPNNLAVSGYTFGGWSATQGGTTPITSDGPINSNQVVYAIWTPGYTLTYDANPPAGAPSPTGSVPSQVTGIAPGSTESLASNPNNLAIAGYTFGGWSATQGGTTPITSDGPINADQTVYAIWTPVPPTYTLTYDANPPAGAPSPTGSVPSQVTSIAPGSTESLASNPNNLSIAGYTFGGWSTTPGGMVPVTSDGPINADQTLYAIWVPTNSSIQAGPQTHTTPLNTPYQGTLAVAGNSVGSYYLVAQPACGTVTVSTDGTYTLVPNQNFTGSCSFSYLLENGSGTAESTATVIVDPVVTLASNAQLASTGFDFRNVGLVALSTMLAGLLFALSTVRRRQRVNP